VIEDRVAGFLAGYCLGDAAARGADDLGRSALAMLASTCRLLSAEVPDPRPLRPEEAPEMVLAVAVPVATAISWRRRGPELTLVDAGWLDHLVGAALGDEVGSVDLAVARSVTRNVARRLLGDPDPGLDSLDGTWPPQPDEVVMLHRALLDDLPLTVDATPGSVLRTSADAFELARSHPGVPAALAAAAGVRPAVAALATGLLGATHGAGALPVTALAISSTASRLAHDIARRGDEAHG
jgi:hypothetical protein